MLATAQPNFAPIATEYVSDAAAHDADLHGILAAATARAARENLPYAGTIPPHEAWTLAAVSYTHLTLPTSDLV